MLCQIFLLSNFFELNFNFWWHIYGRFQIWYMSTNQLELVLVIAPMMMIFVTVKRVWAMIYTTSYRSLSIFYIERAVPAILIFIFWQEVYMISGIFQGASTIRKEWFLHNWRIICWTLYSCFCCKSSSRKQKEGRDSY